MEITLMYDFYSEEGGVERIMLFQANSLKKAGHKVKFAFAYVNESLLKKLEGFEIIEYGKLPIKNEPVQIILSLIRDSPMNKIKNTNLIICHSFPASYIAYKLKIKYKIPYILHLHHPPQFLYNTKKDWANNTQKRKIAYYSGKLLGGLLKRWDILCVKNASGYISECRTVERIIKKTYGVSSQVLYPTVDPVFKILNKNSLGKNNHWNSKEYILGSGRVIKQKRFDYLIEAVAIMKNKIPIVIAGNYDLKEKKFLEELAKNKKLDLKIIGSVNKEELVKLYNCAKLTVLTCPQEWFGLVPIESMACGCPVIAWDDNFGPSETVIKNVNGYLAKPYSEKDLSKKIEEGLARVWDKKEISQSVQKFSEKKVGEVLLKEVNKFI